MKTIRNQECMLQRLQRAWLLPLMASAVFLSLPSQVGGARFIPIHDTLVVRAQKGAPPHIAFESIYMEMEQTSSDWDKLEQKIAVRLEAKDGVTSTKTASQVVTQKIVLPEMLLQRSSKTLMAEVERTKPVSEQGWFQDLSTKQVRRLEEAQRRSDVLDKDWTPPTLAELAQKVLKESESFEPTNERKYYVAARDTAGQLRTEVPPVRWGALEKSAPEFASTLPTGGAALPGPGFVDQNSMHRIVGPIEISGGLAVTNEHHIEVRRNDRGIYKELGRVDIQRGQYNIDVDNPSGTIVAHLVDKDGRILGEGSFRLGLNVAKNQNPIRGPKLKVEPHPDFSGIVTSAYNPTDKDVAPPQTLVSFIKGVAESSAKKDAVVSMANVVKKSSTVMRASAPHHLQTTAIVLSGTEFKTQLYPDNMIAALQSIVSQQRGMSLEDSPRVIWGQVRLDGETLAGIKVQVESAPYMEPIYFNQFMIPDPHLSATSENGLYAFVDVPPGFHSVLATREESIFGYQNLLMEEGTVAQADIQSTIRKEAVPLNVYDAFTGLSVPARITMQSLAENLDSETGQESLLLSPLHRLGLMRVEPFGNEYLPARYIYDDSDAYIHAPLVRWSWLTAIKTYLKFDDRPSTGVIVGFVPDEDFEVYLAGYDSFPEKNIVYFDMRGRILQTGKGLAGGGFIIFNTPADTHEVVVLGAQSQKIYSQVTPVDASSLAVLLFNEQL